MWGTNLSVPLDIVATVGRYPAYQLITRMPIRAPRVSPGDHAVPRRHGGLGRVSPGYPPRAGRLHTCYAPVRRSPPMRCRTALPLDLHVLGLPLAFILSQDQTLHCNI